MKGISLFIAKERGYRVLQKLIKHDYSINSVLVFVQAAHEIDSYTSNIISLCKKNSIDHNTTDNVKPKDYRNYLSKKAPEVLFAISWRYIISENCFSIPKRGIFILHDSLLPKYRGFAPTNWVIINGEKSTGLTLQTIHKEADAGDIVDQVEVPIDSHETASTLNEKLLEIYPQIILDNIDSILDGSFTSVSQNHEDATFACKRTPEDGHLDFNSRTDKLERLIRGLSYPYPGAFCFYNNNKVIIWEAQEVESPMKYVGSIPGRIVSIKRYVDVLTGDGILRIKKVAYSDEPEKFLEPKDVFKFYSYKLI